MGSSRCPAGYFNDLSLAKTNYYGYPQYPFVADDGYPQGATLNSQQDNGLRALSSLYQVALTRHYSIGLVEKSIGTRISLASAISANSMTNNAGMRSSVFQTLAGVDATMESEFGNAWPEAGASGFFSLYNAQGLFFANLTSGNIAGATPSMTNYSTDSLARLNAATSSGYSVITPVNGKAACVPLPNWPPGTTGSQVQACPLAASEPGLNYKADALGYLIGQKWKGNAVSPPSVAVGTERKEYSFKQAQYASIDGARGAAVLKPAPDIVTGWGGYPFSLSFQRTFDTSSTGAIRNTFNPGSINSLPSNVATTVRSSKGWTYLGPGYANGVAFLPNLPDYQTVITEMRHNLEMEARIAANPSIMSGQRSAIEASHFMAAIAGLQSLHSGVSFHNRLATAFTQDWLTTKFRESAVAVSRGTITETYVRLPSGIFYSSSAPDTRLTMTGTRSGPYAVLVPSGGGTGILGVPLAGATGAKVFGYTNLAFELIDGNGSLQIFDGATLPNLIFENFGKDGTAATASRETSSFGLRVDFDTDHTILKAAKNGLGRTLNFAVVTTSPGPGAYNGKAFPFEITAVTDENGRAATYQYGNQSGGYGFKVLRPGTPTEVYDFTSGSYSPNASEIGRPHSRLRRWFTPLDPNNAYQTFVYDPMFRLVGKTDARGNTLSIYGAVTGNENSKVVSQKDGSGNVTVTTYDSSNQVTSMVDPLGRKTVNVYNDAGRLLRTIAPEGNAAEYQYDVRGNQTRECRIAKGAVNWATLNAISEKIPQCNTARTPVADLATTTVYVGGPTLRADQCANMKTCNKVSYTLDPKGLRTDYTWDATHGQLLSEVKPADTSGNRPTITYGYSPFTGVLGAGDTFYLLTSKVETIVPGQTTTTTYEYDTANKFVLKSSLVDSGGLALRTCYKFDAAGNPISKTDPKAGLMSCP